MNNANPTCNFCLENDLLTGTIIAKGTNGFVIEADGKPGNYLIIPYTHARTVQELPDNWWQEMKVLITQIDKPLESYNISINIGKLAGQSVEHVHFWVIPRTPGHASSGIGLWGLMRAIDSAG